MDDTSSKPEPPEQTGKMTCFFKTQPADTSMCSLSDVVPPSNPSYLSRNIFSNEERKFLLGVCGFMVRGGIISKPDVTSSEKKDEGKELLRKFTIDQIINWLKYEKCLNSRQTAKSM